MPCFLDVRLLFWLVHFIFPNSNSHFTLDWMNEGGQSSTGQLLDFMLETHPAYDKLLKQAKQNGVNHFVLLGQLLEELQKEQGAPFLTYLTRELHIYPDLHGMALLFILLLDPTLNSSTFLGCFRRKSLTACGRYHARHDRGLGSRQGSERPCLEVSSNMRSNSTTNAAVSGRSPAQCQALADG